VRELLDAVRVEELHVDRVAPRGVVEPPEPRPAVAGRGDLRDGLVAGVVADGEILARVPGPLGPDRGREERGGGEEERDAGGLHGLTH
jgi:hypothetical protein